MKVDGPVDFKQSNLKELVDWWLFMTVDDIGQHFHCKNQKQTAGSDASGLDLSVLRPVSANLIDFEVQS